MTESEITHQLFNCSETAGNSEHKRSHFIELSKLVLTLAQQIHSRTYRPSLSLFSQLLPPSYEKSSRPVLLIAWYNSGWSHTSRLGTKSGLLTIATPTGKTKIPTQPLPDYSAFSVNPLIVGTVNWISKCSSPSIDRSILLRLWQETLPKLPLDIKTL